MKITIEISEELYKKAKEAISKKTLRHAFTDPITMVCFHVVEKARQGDRMENEEHVHNMVWDEKNNNYACSCGLQMIEQGIR